MKQLKLFRSAMLCLVLASTFTLQNCSKEHIDSETTSINTERKSTSNSQRNYTYSEMIDLNNYPDNTIRIYSKFTEAPDEVPAEPGDWNTSVDQAIADWNNAGSCLNLLRVGTMAEADITIISFYDPINPLVLGNGVNEAETIFGWSEDPSNGAPGEWIWINVNYSNPDGTLPDSNAKRNILGHEIGHNLGFRHSDTFNLDNIINNNFVPANSIMHSGILDRTITGLVPLDIAAYRDLYGNCVAEISGENSICSTALGETYTWTGSGTVSWSVSGNLSLLSSTGTSAVVSGTALGSGILTATQNSVVVDTKQISVTSCGTITGPSSVCINGRPRVYNWAGNGSIDDWQGSSNLILSNETGSSVRVTATGGTSGTLSALQNGVVVATYTVQISTGPTPTGAYPIVNGPSTLFTSIVNSQLYYLSNANFDSYTSVQWVIFSYNYPNAGQNFTIQSPAGNNPFNAVVTANVGTPEETYTLQCRVSDGCGTKYYETTFTVNDTAVIIGGF